MLYIGYQTLQHFEMRITLDNFRNFVPPKIWSRGVAYFEDGAVVELEEISRGQWRATVEGTEDYHVEISLDGDEVLSWMCDCPYDGGDICKHVVAVVLAVREQRGKDLETASSPANVRDAAIVGKTGLDTDFHDLLKLAKDKDFKNFIVSYASSHDDFKTDFMGYLRSIYLYPSSGNIDYAEEVVKIFRSALKKHIGHGRSERYYDYDFYIDWGELCSKINRLLDDTALLMKLGKAEPAVSVTLQLFRSLAGLDDEDIFYDPPAVLSDCCMKAGNLLTEASVHDSVPAGKKTGIVEELLKLALAENLSEIYDMDGLFLDINSRVNSPDASVELIDRQIRNMDGSYRQSRYIIAKIDILRDMGKMEEAQKTADEFMHIDEVCRHEVEWLQSLNRLDDALRLVNNAISYAQKESFSGKVCGWMEVRMHIHECMGDTASVISDCHQIFIRRNGSMEYYHKLKELVPGPDWKRFLEDMLDQIKPFAFGGSDVKADIYAEEKEYGRLFGLIETCSMTTRLDMLMNYALGLPSSYAPALLKQCVTALELYVANNLGRNHYSYMARILRMMQKLDGGKEVVRQLVEKFREQYKRRRAMMEELAAFS